MRLFFALWPDDGVRERLAHWSRELRAACGGRPTRAENLHMTLVFLGAVDEARLAEVERAASQVEPRSLALLLDRPGFWKHNRIAWAGATLPPPELEALVGELREALGRARIAFDRKGFVSHVTLLRDAREGTMPELEPIRWEVKGFALLRSPAQPGRYEVLRSWG